MSNDGRTASQTFAARTAEHLARGIPVFPVRNKKPLVKGGFKSATTDPAQIDRWSAQFPDADVAMPTGKVTNTVVTDIDPKHGGDESLADLEAAHAMLPETQRATTPSGGSHAHFRFPPGVERVPSSASKIAPGIDVRGDGGYVVMPGSRGYEWDAGAHPDDVPLADLPEWLLELMLQDAGRAAEGGNDAGVVPKGQRNDTLASLGGTMRRRGMTPAAIAAALVAENQRRCDPPLPEPEVRAIAASVSRYSPEEDGSVASVTSVAAAWPAPLADEAFHGLAGAIVRAIEPESEADPAALLGQLLTGFGNVVGRGPHFVAESDRHPLNLYVVVVAPTSKGRKGSSWGRVKHFLQATDPEWVEERVQAGLSSGEGLIWAVRDEIWKSEPVKVKGRVTEYQDVLVDPGVPDKRLLVVEGEYASTLRVLAREGNILSPTIRSAWDTGDLRTMTKNSPAKATGAHISVIGHITKDELLRYLDRTEAGNGFGNRHLWMCARRSKILPEGGGSVQGAADLARRLNQAVEAAGSVGEVRRDDEARRVWGAIYEPLSEGKPGLLGAMIARAEAQVMRLACIYALLDLSSLIRIEHLLAALALWDYAEASARYIFGDALGDPLADPLLRTLRQAPEGMTRTQIRDLFGRHERGSAVDRALAMLAEQGLAHVLKEETGGRPRERWLATKATKATKATEAGVSSHSSLSSHPAPSYLALAKAAIEQDVDAQGRLRAPERSDALTDHCRVCDADMDAYLPDGTPVCDQHNVQRAGAAQALLLDVAEGSDLIPSPPAAGARPEPPSRRPPSESAGAACSSCGGVLDAGRCWKCDVGRCRDCGVQTSSALAIYCPRCRVNPQPRAEADRTQT